MEAAIKFVNDQFPDCSVAILAGSASRGEETPTSDLDIVIIQDGIHHYRESFEEYGWRIECFTHNFESCLAQFQSEREQGRPILASMLVNGKMLKDDGRLEMIRDAGAANMALGPEPLSKEFIEASRYFIVFRQKTPTSRNM
ncbi:nucleotidyltransferase domain-containing protein [Paenibacillus faecalis]|uniref:nucleotidyltransferase domain-containing protein n=1 Tax=Paenibacillus faecalis TaxID=2079532 RepID=UPI00131A5DE9|nr:nucleotidyltransferase domain-containing protein [Paenibacillus faecalis]